MQAQSSRTFTYRRREPETKLLYQVPAREWETWSAERRADSDRTPLPPFVEREMEAYFRCGILDHGFSIVSCETCDQKVPVAYSCKRRRVCPSCCAKRMSDGRAPARAPPRRCGWFDDIDQSEEGGD